MSDIDELISYFNTLGFKKNPNDYNIVKKWNRRLYTQYKYDIFNLISKYIDEHIVEFIQIQQPSMYDLVSSMVSANTFKYGDKINYNPMPIDEHEHMWYNQFNKWGWNKFENGVIKIE